MEELHDGEEEDDVDNPEDEEYSRDIDDEDIRPAKGQKLPARCTNKILKPSRKHSAKLSVRLPRHLISPLSIIIEIDDVWSKHRCLLTSIDEEQRYSPRTSRSPSAVVESVPAAEYQEWPSKVTSNATGSERRQRSI